MPLALCNREADPASHAFPGASCNKPATGRLTQRHLRVRQLGCRNTGCRLKRQEFVSMKHNFRSFGTRTIPEPRRFRPSLEDLEARDVPSITSWLSPALGPALASVAPAAQQAASLFPITVNDVNITGVANNALQLV